MMLLKVEEDKAVLMTKPTAKVLTVISQLEGNRRWLKGGGLQVENTSHNIGILSAIEGVEVLWPEKDEPSDGADVFDIGTSTYKPKTEPYKHQLKALEKMKGKNAFGLFMEQGTGKTKTIIDWAGELYTAGKITGILVVSKKGVHRQWIESELQHHANVNCFGAFWPLKYFPEELLPGGSLKLLAFNYDGLKTISGYSIAEEFCKAHKGRLMIVSDESQEIKNARSQRHKAMMKLKPYSSYRVLATGTPIAKDLTDEWAQMKWLDEDIIGIKYVTAFRVNFCIMGGFEGRSVVGHRNVDEFKRRTDPYTFRITKEEIGLLPKQYNEWYFDLTTQQHDLIESMKNDLEAILDSGQKIEMTNVATVFGKMQQVAGGFIIDEDQNIHRLMPLDKNPRINAMLDWVNGGEGKAIIWARFRQDMAMVHEALERSGVNHVQYHGGISDKDRAEAVRSFLDKEGAQILLANPQSAGTGLNLQGLCNRALYYTNSFNAIDRWQSEDRIHRIGTVGAVTYTDLIGKKSIDRYIMNNLKRKKGLSNLVLGDIAQMIRDIG